MNKYLCAVILILILSCKSKKINSTTSQDLIIPTVLDKYQDSLKEKRFGIAALVKHNNMTETYAIGIAGDSTLMTPDKVFNIGSMSKLFTAVLIMQEVERNNISLSDSLFHFFPPSLVKNENVDLNINIEQLLRHESGLGEVLIDTLANESLLNPYFEYNNNNLFDKIPQPIFEPGKKYHYTNTNFILLGYILEATTNKSYHTLLKERIFNPSNMVQSYPYYSPAITNAAHPMFDGVDYTDQINYKYYQYYCYAAGGIASTLIDLQKFFVHLFEKKTFLKQEYVDLMVDTNSEYGLGIQITKSTKHDYKYYGHAGDNFSFALQDFYDPNNGDMVIVFSNQFVDPYTFQVANDLIKVLLKNKNMSNQ